MLFSPSVRVSVCEAPVFTSPTLVVPPLASTPVSDFTSAPPARSTLPDSKLPLPGLCIVRIVETAPRPLPVTPPRLESKMRLADAVYGAKRHVASAKSVARPLVIPIRLIMILVSQVLPVASQILEGRYQEAPIEGPDLRCRRQCRLAPSLPRE